MVIQVSEAIAKARRLISSRASARRHCRPGPASRFLQDDQTGGDWLAARGGPPLPDREAQDVFAVDFAD
jgi:hypothetical protein